MRRLVLASALLVATTTPAAPPREARDEATLRARELFDHAEALYALTRYAEALGEYERAFERRPLPGFLFNIAQCHRQLGNHAKAARFYRSYLERQPGARNRALVESLLHEVEAAAARAAPPVPPPESPTAMGSPDADAGSRASDGGSAPDLDPRSPPDAASLALPRPPPGVTAPFVGPVAPPPPKPMHRRWYVWTAAALGAAALGLGLGLGLTTSGPPTGTLDTVDARR